MEVQRRIEATCRDFFVCPNVWLNTCIYVDSKPIMLRDISKLPKIFVVKTTREVDHWYKKTVYIFIIKSLLNSESPTYYQNYLCFKIKFGESIKISAKADHTTCHLFNYTGLAAQLTAYGKDLFDDIDMIFNVAERIACDMRIINELTSKTII